MEESRPEEQQEWVQHYVLLYVSPPSSRARVPEFFAAQSAYSDAFQEAHPGALLMTGPFPQTEQEEPGAMSVFVSREAAAEFAASDPFVLHGLVEKRSVRLWLVSGRE
jgi:uncharacterized protein